MTAASITAARSATENPPEKIGVPLNLHSRINSRAGRAQRRSAWI